VGQRLARIATILIFCQTVQGYSLGGPDGDSGRLRPTSRFGLAHAIMSSIAHREAETVGVAREVGLMD
jgi:hypothetical protein